MEIKNSRPEKSAAASTGDDLRAIHGIGPAIEERLIAAGILTYAQLATRSPDYLAGLFTDMTGLSSRRIAELDWIGQARMLAGETGLPETEEGELGDFDGQHYAVFTVEYLLDKDNGVRRTRAMHVGTQREEIWAGWDARRLLNFIIGQANLAIPPEISSPAAGEELKTLEVVEALSTAAPSTAVPSTTAIPASVKAPTALRTDLEGELHLRQFTVQSNGHGERRAIQSGRPFVVQLTLDLTEVKASTEVPLEYRASLYAKELSSGDHLELGEARGSVLPVDILRIDVGNKALEPGLYRMTAVVLLGLPGQEPKVGSGLIAMMEGGLIVAL
jgi:hypothetical protein